LKNGTKVGQSFLWSLNLDVLRRKLLDKKIDQKRYDLEVAKVRKEIDEIQHRGF
jgi:hypothetical protein